LIDNKVHLLQERVEWNRKITWSKFPWR